MQTPFEEVGGQSWTKLARMVEFIHDLADSSDRAEVIQLGRTVQNRPIYALAVGEPTPTLRGGPVAFHVSGQHGFEHGAYESAIAQARDLTETTDPTAVATLQKVTWLILPSASPDTMGHRKYNEQGVDINRDHVARTLPETRAIMKALRDYRPCLTLDSHSAHMSYDFAATTPNDYLGNHPSVVSASKGVMAAMADALNANSRWFSEYTGSSKNLREVLTNASAFAHSPTVLLEGSRSADPVDAQVVAKIVLDATHAYLGEHLDELVQAEAASRNWVTPPFVTRTIKPLAALLSVGP